MDDPVNEIPNVVLRLTQGSPKIQEQTINQYFTTNASFTHPFCRTGSFEGSRLLIHGIFRWYKIMSPRIEAKVNGIAYDERNLVLYVNISQVFAIWFVPFHRSPVTLTTQLQLVQRTSPNSTHPTDASRKKYYIQSQNDLYPVDQFVRFFAPWGVGDAVVYLWHFWATLFCVLLSVVFTPFSRLMESWTEGRLRGVPKIVANGVVDIEKRRMHGAEGAEKRMAAEIENAANDIRRETDRIDLERIKEEVGMTGGKEEHGQKRFGNMQVVT